jgi:hypothetical protein
MNIHQAIKYAKEHCPNHAAISRLHALPFPNSTSGYAKDVFVKHTIKQALYNMRYWKGSKAQAVKNVLRELVK